jgi:regulator of protease activity HflC (stomatin/prohibitin superfamily)
LNQEQEALAYEYRLVTEQREAERKKIEATGISDFQKAVTPGITPQYLRWRGIEATLELAKSNNAKLVIIGGKDGLPIILNTPDVNINPPGQQR